MAHGLTENDTMFSARILPWHKIGTVVDGCLSSEEAIKTAGLDWEVRKSTVYVAIEDEDNTEYVPLPRQYIMTRSDKTGLDAILGTVGNVYEPLQNVDAFKFCDSLVGEANAKYETAGSLDGGKRIWLSIKMPDILRVANTDDISEEYIVVTNGHTGSDCVTALITAIRVVCQNTLNASLKGAKALVSIRHTGAMQIRMNQAQEILAASHQYFAQFVEYSNVLNAFMPNQKQIASYVEALYPVKDRKQNLITRNAVHQAAVMQLFEGSETCTMDGIKDSMWALYNAVIEHEDWRKVHGEKKKDEASVDEARLVRNLFKPTEMPTKKQNALDLALKVATKK